MSILYPCPCPFTVREHVHAHVNVHVHAGVSELKNTFFTNLTLRYKQYIESLTLSCRRHREEWIYIINDTASFDFPL
jgi:hypothetical protein